MVEYKTTKAWQCQYCGTKFSNHDSAVQCALDCADIDYPIEVEKITYICDYCGKEYIVESNADVCEQEHQDLEDEFFTRKGLIEAAKHPKQKKLSEVLK